MEHLAFSSSSSSSSSSTSTTTTNTSKGKGKAVPLQAWTVPEDSRNLRFPEFVTPAQDGGRLSALRTDRLLP